MSGQVELYLDVGPERRNWEPWACTGHQNQVLTRSCPSVRRPGLPDRFAPEGDGKEWDRPERNHLIYDILVKQTMKQSPFNDCGTLGRVVALKSRDLLFESPSSVILAEWALFVPGCLTAATSWWSRRWCDSATKTAQEDHSERKWDGDPCLKLITSSFKNLLIFRQHLFMQLLTQDSFL